jgi:hypothetical protein
MVEISIKIDCTKKIRFTHIFISTIKFSFLPAKAEPVPVTISCLCSSPSSRK